MCYMKTEAEAEAVGVRELRQNLSVYLVRVIAGETLEVTDRGRPVARLTPIAVGEALLARLEREGRAVPATGDLLSGRRVRSRRPGSASRELQRTRSDRRL